MCGRFARTSSREVLAEEFGVAHFADADFCPRYNVAPSQAVEAILRQQAENHLELMRWGLATSSEKAPPINARGETVATAPPFRDAFRRRRCLIVADGFYEWRKDGPGKIPYFIHLRSGRPFGFAGIWSLDHGAAGGPLATCATVTCSPNPLMARIHDRMPVILPKAARDRWLDPNAAEVELRALLTPLRPEEMEVYPVSTLVNSARNDTPECIRPVEG